MFINFLLVAAGGATGAMLRYGAGLLVKPALFPWATFAVNISGCFIIGLLYGLAQRNALAPHYWLLLATGLCGGFTTFSAFSLENLQLIQQQQYALFFAYALGSLALGLPACWAGYAITK
jgi:fluoride exporter